MPLFVLAGFYTGLFFVLNNAKDPSKKRPKIQQKLGPPKFRPPTPDAPPRVKLSPEEQAAAQAEWEEYLADLDAKDAAGVYRDPWEGRP